MPTLLSRFSVDIEPDGSVTCNGESLDRAPLMIDRSEWRKVDVQRQYYVSCRVAQTLVLVRILAKDQREREELSPGQLHFIGADGRWAGLINMIFERTHEGKVTCSGWDLDVQDSPMVCNELPLAQRTTLKQKLKIVELLTEFWEALNYEHKRQRVKDGELIEESGVLRSTTGKVTVGM